MIVQPNISDGQKSESDDVILTGNDVIKKLIDFRIFILIMSLIKIIRDRQFFFRKLNFFCAPLFLKLQSLKNRLVKKNSKIRISYYEKKRLLYFLLIFL